MRTTEQRAYGRYQCYWERRRAVFYGQCAVTGLVLALGGLVAFLRWLF